MLANSVMLSRRSFLTAAAAACVRPARSSSAATVAVAKCPTYGPELLGALNTVFDQLGGLGRFVKGRTVALKLNLTGTADTRLRHHGAEESHFTHPRVTAAVCHLMGRAGARRIRLLEGCFGTADPLEEFMLQVGWDPREFTSAAPRVEFENTNLLGNAKRYVRFQTPRGGYIYPGFDLNHSYYDCDVFVTLAKLKEHATAGVTLAMKNSFGIAPTTIYGTGAGADEPSEVPRGGRGMFHDGSRQPPKSAPQENPHNVPADDKARVPRIVVDLVAARPIDLSIVEGIRTMAGGEGPWIGAHLPVVSPGLLVAGTNPVATDAVCTALMGFDPLAERGTPPFERCDSTLSLAEKAGLGPRDLKQIEVAGVPIRETVYPFRKRPRYRGL